jgi:hypothetical protein
MINLLPPKEKKELLLIKTNRLFVVLGSALLVFAVCLILVLLSVYYFILKEKSAQKSLVDQTYINYKTEDISALENSLKKHDANISKLKVFYKDESAVSDVLKIISKIEMPKDLYLTDIFLDRKDLQKEAYGEISGFSKNRESLLVFRDNIEKEASIINPIFSPESWTNSENIKFDLKFKVKLQ